MEFSELYSPWITFTRSPKKVNLLENINLAAILNLKCLLSLTSILKNTKTFKKHKNVSFYPNFQAGPMSCRNCLFPTKITGQNDASILTEETMQEKG